MKTLKIVLLFQVFAMACNAQMYRDYEMRDSLNYPLSIYYLKPINGIPQVLTVSNTFLDKSVSLVRLDGANVIYDKYFHPHNDSLIIVNSQGSTGIRPLCHIDNPKDSSYFIAFNLKDDYQFVTEVAMVLKMKYDGDTVWTQKHPGSQIQDIILMQDSILIWGGTGITSVNAITGEYIDSGFSPTSANTFQQVFYQIEHRSTDSTLFFVGARTPFGGWRQGLFGLMSYNGIYLWTKTYSLNNRAPFFKKMQKTSTGNFYLMNHVEDSIGSNFTNITYVDSLGNVRWSKNYYYPYAYISMEPTDIILTKDDGCILLSSDLSTILFKVDTTGTIQWCHQLKSDLGTKIIGAKKINVFDTASIVLDGFQLYQVDLDGWSCNYINFPLVDSNVTVTVDTITLWNYVPPPPGLYQSGLTQLSMLPVMPLFPLVDSCLHTVSIPSISSNKNNNIMLFPNPGSSVVSITSDNLFDKIILHDVTCREIKIMKTKNPTANWRVDIRTLPSGIYFVDVYNKEIKIGGMKLLKVE